MKHFLTFVVVVFVALFLVLLNRRQQLVGEERPTLRIYSYSSFTSQWGPGPQLKEIFERDCNCRVEFADGHDAGVLLQRLKIEGESLGADLVVGFDQFDLQKALVGIKWQQMNIGHLNFEDQVKPALANNYFIPYDWGALTFMTKKEGRHPGQLNDLLDDEYNRKILIEDPRTSSPGFQLVYWIMKTKGEEEGFKFIQRLLEQVNTVTPSWSNAIALFNKSPSNLVFSYVTSPLYYELEEKNSGFSALNFQEPLPMQVEFLGVPDFCRHCELSERFVNLMMSPEGQKVLMSKNYMLPVLKGVKDGTPFADVLAGRKLIGFEIPSEGETDRLLKRWSELRRGKD